MFSKIILKVSELTALSKRYLEDTFSEILVEGEISNLSYSPNGHGYFSLKDKLSQVKAVLFRSKFPKFPLTNGIHVLVHAKVSLYEPRGDFQILIERLDLIGTGLCYQQFILLKNKLESLGWFDQAKKQVIELPKKLGIITSPGSAVIKDLLTTLQLPLKIIIYPTLTQGLEAPSQIIRAITLASKRQECDLLIIARGGGSYEDLAVFNDEGVAASIFYSKIPIISAIGHETDFTIADFIADYRAPTPTAAAELIMNKFRIKKDHLIEIKKQLNFAINFYLEKLEQKLLVITQRLKNPIQKLEYQGQALKNLRALLTTKFIHFWLKKQNIASYLTAKLRLLNPEQPLQRGFVLITDSQQKIISKTKDLIAGNKYQIKFQDGKLTCIITDSSD